MHRIGLAAGLCIAISCLGPLPAARAITPDPIPDPGFRLTVRVIDAITRQDLPARVSVTGSDGESIYPIPRRSHFYHQAYFGHKYFYSNGPFTVMVSPGNTVIAAMKGFEYQAVRDTFPVAEDGTVLVEMQRFFDLRTFGWRSGDTHVHMNHGGIDTYDLTTDDLFLMQQAEDVGVVNALENGLNFIGGVDPISDSNHILYYGVEYRSAFWGHMGVLGISQLTSFGCCSRGQAAFPMNVDLTNSARQYGGTVVFAHPITMPREDMHVIDKGWPSVGHGRELPVDLALGEIDAIDVMSYSNLNKAEYATWYDLLNHGFHIPATAGTDASVNRFTDPPLGGYRVYAQVGPLGWTYDSWLEAIRSGNTFITNGPLVKYFHVANAEPGDGISMTAAESRHVFCNLDVVSQWPIDQAVIIVNGVPKGYVFPTLGDKSRIVGGVYIDTGGKSAWVALKVIGYSPNPFTIGAEIQAHTSPVYISVPGKPILFGGYNPAYYVQWIDELWSLSLAKGFDSPADRDLTESRLTRARALILARTVLGPDHDAQDLPPRPVNGTAEEGTVSREPVTIVPTAAGGGRGLAFRFEGGDLYPETFELYDVTGRRVATRRIDQTEAGSGTWTWRTAGEPLRGGVYFAVFRGQDWSRRVRVTYLP